MKYTRLGRTGLEVSRICLGCMSFGDPKLGRSWVLAEDDARPLLKTAWEAGINFYDTANVYSAGTSEEITGTILKELSPNRDDYVLATKVHGEMRKGPNGHGLSRKAILSELDNSLRRLKLDYVDLYQIHRFDPHTPMEETLEALSDVVRAGKVRYIGASSMAAWQFAQMLAAQDKHGWARFVSMQDHVNLLYREEEREMLPLCLKEGIGVIPWSPLARGRLTRPWDTSTHRAETDEFGKSLYTADDASKAIVGAVVKIAEARGVPAAQVATAWVLQLAPVTAPIVGATKASHVEDAVAAVDLVLTDDEIAALEAPYPPRAVAGFASPSIRKQ